MAVKNQNERTLLSVQQYIQSLKGKEVQLVYLNRGHTIKESGTITDVYKNIFIFEYDRNDQHFKSSFTYTDILTNNIDIVLP